MSAIGSGDGVTVARPSSRHLRASWQSTGAASVPCQLVVGPGDVAVVVRRHQLAQVLANSAAVTLAGDSVWWFRTDPTSVRVDIDWQGGRERQRYALALEVSFVVADAAALATWLLDQQEPDDIVEVLIARAVSRRVSWLLAELGPVRSELQRVIVSEIRTNAIRPICPGVSLRQVIVSQCERQESRVGTAVGTNGASRGGDTPPVTAATAAYRVEDLIHTAEIDVSAVMSQGMSSETNSEIVLLSSDVLPAVDSESDASNSDASDSNANDNTQPALVMARASAITEDDSEPYDDIEMAVATGGGLDQRIAAPPPREHPQYPFGARVLVADPRGRWQTAVVTRSGEDQLEVQIEHTGMVLTVSPDSVMPA